jgi:hypothetical protein
MTIDLTRLIKPLVWEEKVRGEYYRSDIYAVRSSYGRALDNFMLVRHAIIIGWFPEASAAQAAANADNAARVLAAIDTALIAELVEALESIATKSYYAKGPGNTAQTVATAALAKLNVSA